MLCKLGPLKALLHRRWPEHLAPQNQLHKGERIEKPQNCKVPKKGGGPLTPTIPQAKLNPCKILLNDQSTQIRQSQAKYSPTNKLQIKERMTPLWRDYSENVNIKWSKQAGLLTRRLRIV